MSEYVPEDNLVLIFKRLPVKTLLRFRCVCKSWKQLIDSPTFVHEHLTVQKPHFLGEDEESDYLVVDPHTRPPLVENLRGPDVDRNKCFFGTLHGVVCLLNWKRKQLLIWNPSVRKFLTVALPDRFQSDFLVNRLWICYGFWIDPSTKEFKIIIVQRKPVVTCFLYSSIRHDWSFVFGEKVENWKCWQYGPPVMIGGVAHWHGCFDNQPCEHKDKLILSFDFVQESFDIIKMPPHLKHLKYALCHWQGKLCLLCWKVKFPQMCDIYLREEDCWVKMFDFKFNMCKHIADAFWVLDDMEETKEKGKMENVRVLATVEDESSEFCDRICELVLSGTKTGCVPLRREIFDFDYVHCAYDFVESLLFP